MNADLLSALETIGKENGSIYFINRTLFKNIISKYYNENNNEYKLLMRLANAGYLSSIAKDCDKNDKIISDLYEDESIDKDKATDFVESLSRLFNTIKQEEKNIIEYNKKVAKEKEKMEQIKEQRHMEELLFVSLTNILKSKGIEILKNYNYCRAILKDMARGDYIDEITKISLLLKNNIHRAILKKRFYKISDDDLLSKITRDYIEICSLKNEDNILIAILYNAIKSFIVHQFK